MPRQVWKGYSETDTLEVGILKIAVCEDRPLNLAAAQVCVVEAGPLQIRVADIGLECPNVRQIKPRKAEAQEIQYGERVGWRVWLLEVTIPGPVENLQAGVGDLLVESQIFLLARISTFLQHMV